MNIDRSGKHKGVFKHIKTPTTSGYPIYQHILLETQVPIET